MTRNERRLREALINATCFLQEYVNAAGELTRHRQAAKEGIKELKQILDETEPKAKK